MSLIVGTNSWVTIAEADTYLEDSMNAGDWFDLPIESGTEQGSKSRSSVLITAFRWLMSHSSLSGLSASLTDDNVKQAQIESAIFLLRYQSDYERRDSLRAMGVSQMSVSKWSESLEDVTLPSNIASLLSSYTIRGGMIVTLRGDTYTDG